MPEPPPPITFQDEDSTVIRFDTPSRRAGRELQLHVLCGDDVATYRLPEEGSVVLGRSADADITIDAPSISRRHARLHLGDELAIEDLASANGTTVRGQRLEANRRAPLAPGDVVEVGEAMVLVQGRFAGEQPQRPDDYAYFRRRLDEETARARRTDAPFVLMRLRVSGPSRERRAIRYGLAEELRAADVVGAYGPGDYDILLVDADRERGRAILARLRKRLGDVVRAGLAQFPVNGRTADELLARAREQLGDRTPVYGSAPLIIESAAMRNLHRVVRRVAGTSINVLLLGETGVGKEVLAEILHATSPRSSRPLVRLNCAALSETLLESELFGHARGAFTGADADKPGLLESAEGGTVFLDEIGDLPERLQTKLLRVLEERRIRRVGSVESRPIDVRFVSATNRDLERDVQAGRFRQDLFFRLNGFAIVIPPLRERADEIEPLARGFALEAAASFGSPPPRLSDGVLALLRAYPWPGNIRELRNAIERAVVLADGGEILPEHLPLAGAAPRGGGGRGRFAALQELESLDLKENVAAFERELVAEALRRSDGNQTRAAELLGVSRQTLMARLDEHGLPRPRKSPRR